MSTATTEELSTADKARRKAEARRKRILAKSSQRLDVVNGLAPSDAIKTTSPTTSKNDEPTKDDVVLETVASQETTDSAAAVDTFAAADARMESLTNDTGPSSKGARRMAAMRKRRYKNKSKDKEETTVAAVVEDIKKDEEPVTENETTTDEEKPTVLIPPESPMSIATEKQEPDLFSPLSIATEVCNKENDIPSPTNSRSSTPSIIDTNTNNNNDEPTKKYMGVARMRRLRNAQQKAQRLKEINDADIIGTSPSKNDVNIQRELVAEMATMNATASMIRDGVNLDTPKGCGVSLSSLATSSKKNKGKWWISKLLPPMKLVPHMVTLLLLFLAGLDLGMQPHYSRDDTTSPLSFGGSGGGEVVRDLSASPRKLIQHVESSLTKPWEYGLGGKVAYAVGMAPSSPPTALPTSFKFIDDDDAVGVGECIPGEVEGTSGECIPSSPKDESSDDNGGKKKRKKKVKVQQLAADQDEFDDSLSTKDTPRPKGVDHESEFHDDDGTTTTMKVPIIDPLFQVDLDSLLTNANLPLPIEYAAKVAIGFHRMWVYYLWILPTSAMKSLFTLPKNVFSGWVANPPWILGVVLFIRFVTKIIIGNGGKSFTLNSDDNSEGNDESSGGIGGGGGKNLDVVGKGIDMAKNYVTSKFPKTMLIGGTLMTVMKVDMYVVLCGLLIGLVMPTIKDDYLTWGGAAVIVDNEEGTMSSSSVLGDGEL